jgi:uncharacterized membrane protein (UPF0127 family)
MTRLFLFALSVAALLLSVGCESDPSSQETSSDTTATIPFDTEGELVILQDQDSLVTLDLEIAETDSARERGMMQRDGFPNETSGMLFPFDAEEERSFWMANTPVALDLFFIDADSQIVHIARYARPNSPDPIPSEEPAQYVLETPAGFADSYGVLEGDRVRWRRID